MKRTPAVLLLVLGLAAGPGRAALPEGAAELWLGHWQAESWGLDESGSFCLVSAAPGCRWEIRRSGRGQGRWDELWSQSGEGWTVVQVAGGDGIWNAWGREWTRLEPVVGRFLDLLAATAREWNGSGFTGARKVAVPELDPVATGSFRARLVRRGLGQGEAGEMVTLTRTADGTGDTLLTIRSSRRPGNLRLLTAVRDVLPEGLPAEVFAPLWPLADFLETPRDFSGTGGP
ncbi:MAG: hypothetical protein AB7V45_10680 [Candidatus Krumholzibacteriia bacterium]